MPSMQGPSDPLPDESRELLPVQLRRLLPARDSAGLVLDAGGKFFLIMIGPAEAAAVMRELSTAKPERPLTHDLIGYILTGFDITVESVVISSMVNGAFCATLTLQRKQGEMSERVRFDVRASDAIVLAIKHSVHMQVTRLVLDQVEDISKMIKEVDQHLAADAGGEPSDDPAEPGAGPDTDTRPPSTPLL